MRLKYFVVLVCVINLKRNTLGVLLHTRITFKKHYHKKWHTSNQCRVTVIIILLGIARKVLGNLNNLFLAYKTTSECAVAIVSEFAVICIK